LAGGSTAAGRLPIAAVFIFRHGAMLGGEGAVLTANIRSDRRQFVAKLADEMIGDDGPPRDFQIAPMRPPWHDLKPLLAESFVEAGKDVAVVAVGADFVFSALNQHVSLEQAIEASNDHGRRSISSSNQSKTTSTGIKVSVTQQMIPVRAAIRYGVMALLSPLLCGHCLDRRQPRRHC
jgi:hypothetical protein